MCETEEVDRYYAKHFPCNELCALLGRAWKGEDMLRFREIALETHESVYVRFGSVSCGDELRRSMMRKRASKVHVGAIFDKIPTSKKERVSPQPTQRELVFDIDIDDSTNSGIDPNDITQCDNAWPLVAFGMKVVETVLKKHFGFVNMLTVYSGRRGAHLTVYDTRACLLTNEERSAIVDFMQPQMVNDVPWYGNMMSSAFFGELWTDMVLPFWLQHGLKSRDRGGSGFLETASDVDDFVKLLGTTSVTDDLKVGRLGYDERAWKALWDRAVKRDDEAKQKFNNSKRFNEFRIKCAVLSYVWPRLDANVTKQRNHLSKSVFSVHPKTGRVCVPLLGALEDEFDPKRCPHVKELADGLEEHISTFKEYVRMFGAFIDELKLSETEAQPDLLCYSMVEPKKAKLLHEDALISSYISNKSRVCYNLKRVIVVRSTIADPSIVTIAWYTTTLSDTAKGSVQIVPAGYCPPFRARELTHRNAALTEYKERKGTRRDQKVSLTQEEQDQLVRKYCLRQGIDLASRSPDSEIFCVAVHVCVFPQAISEDVNAASQRLRSMLPDLKKRQVLTRVNATWGADQIDCFLDTHVVPIWNVKRIHVS